MVDSGDELTAATSTDKIQKYQEAKNRWVSFLNVTNDATEEQKQLRFSEILSDIFGREFSFVGFYDKREDNDAKIFIGQFVSNAEIFPCGEIALGSGQCGQCAKEMTTLIVHDVRHCDNYIACDTETQSEIVVPCCLNGKLRTVLDIDSPDIGTFTEVDKTELQDLIYMVYERPPTSSVRSATMEDLLV